MHGEEALSSDQITAGWQPARIGRRVQVWAKVASTNDLALRAAGVPDNDGLVILAEEQTAGRGRQGRSWQTPAGSAVLMSVVMFPPPALAAAEVLVCLSAVAVAQALEVLLQPACQIKWPNDLVVQGQKIAGILVERGAGTVLGIGINVHAVPASADVAATATCLARHARTPVSRNEVVRRVLRSLDAWYDRLQTAATANPGGLAGPLAELVQAWQQRTAFVGECVEVTARTGRHTGTLVEIDPLSQLTLRPARGPATVLPIGELQQLRRIS